MYFGLKSSNYMHHVTIYPFTSTKLDYIITNEEPHTHKHKCVIKLPLAIEICLISIGYHRNGKRKRKVYNKDFKPFEIIK